MAGPKATINPPGGGPIATGGKPQKPSKPVAVKGHTRAAPAPKATPKPKFAGLSPAKIRYWQSKLGPNASVAAINKARNVQIARHDPNAFGLGANLSPLQADLQSQAAGRLKFGSTLSADQTQINNIPGWYQAYQQQVAQLQQQAAQANQAAVTGINTSGQQIAGQQQSNQQNALQAMGQDAANRGAQVDPNLAASSSQFQAGLAALNASDATRTQAVGQSQQNYLGNLGLIQQAAGQQNLTRAQRQVQLDQQAQADYQSQFKQGLIQNAQKVGIENQTLGATINKNNVAAAQNAQKIKLATGIANANATHQHNQDVIAKGTLAYKQMQSDRTFQLQSNKFGFEVARDNYQRAHHVGPYKPNKATGGFTPQQLRQQQQNKTKILNSARNQFNQALANANEAKGANKLSQGNQDAAAATLSQKLHIPMDLAVAAVQTAIYGGAGPGHVKVLKQRYGLSVKQFVAKAHG